MPRLLESHQAHRFVRTTPQQLPTQELVAPVPSKTLLAGEHSGGYGDSDGVIELQVVGTVRPASMCRFPSSNSENLAVQLAC